MMRRAMFGDSPEGYFKKMLANEELSKRRVPSVEELSLLRDMVCVLFPIQQLLFFALLQLLLWFFLLFASKNFMRKNGLV